MIFGPQPRWDYDMYEIKLWLKHIDPECLEYWLIYKILHKYQDVFEGLGYLPIKYRITVDDTVTPVVDPPQKVPVALRERIKQELEHMESLNIIEKVTAPSDWVSSMVTVVKPQKIRICLDPNNLNKAIKREHFPMTTIEEVATRMAGGKVFSVLDTNSGFWQI